MSYEITRKEALSRGLKEYFTGKPCKHGHISPRRVDNRCCVKCSLKSSRKWKRENIDQISSYQKSWRKQNSEHCKSYDSKRYYSNLQYHSEKNKKWSRENPEKVRAKNAKRRAIKASAIPPWANLEKIKEFYQNCPEGYHVDHIVPLQHPLVCGLHVSENLQYLTAEENLKKGNSFKEEW